MDLLPHENDALWALLLELLAAALEDELAIAVVAILDVFTELVDALVWPSNLNLMF